MFLVVEIGFSEFKKQNNFDELKSRKILKDPKVHIFQKIFLKIERFW